MNTYYASEELVKIFEKNGFNEITHERYPQHADRIKNNGYNPNAQKRAFIFGNRKRNVLTLDYINIVPYYRGACNGDESRLSVSEDELKSIIAFYKLPAQTQLVFKANGQKITELSVHYQRISQNTDLYKRKSDKQIRSTYENVRL